MNKEINKNETLIKEKQNLLTEKKFLEEELKSVETVIQCQTRKNEINKRLRELEESLLLIHIQIIKEQIKQTD